VKTGVQEIGKALKTLDSGFRRNDEKKKRTNFFTPSSLRGERGAERSPRSTLKGLDRRFPTGYTLDIQQGGVIW
jgi:hypothetical protein